MAQLIQNGDLLTGTSNNSANILYSEPDGSSKNVQEKIEELNNSLYFHGEKVSNPFNATANWEEHINSFIAPSDGWLYLLVGSATDQPSQLSVDGNIIFYDVCAVYTQYTSWRSGCFFIKKGQTAEFRCIGKSYIYNSYFLKL